MERKQGELKRRNIRERNVTGTGAIKHATPAQLSVIVSETIDEVNAMVIQREGPHKGVGVVRRSWEWAGYVSENGISPMLKEILDKDLSHIPDGKALDLLQAHRQRIRAEKKRVRDAERKAKKAAAAAAKKMAAAARKAAAAKKKAVVAAQKRAVSKKRPKKPSVKSSPAAKTKTRATPTTSIPSCATTSSSSSSFRAPPAASPSAPIGVGRLCFFDLLKICARTAFIDASCDFTLWPAFLRGN